MLWKKIERFAEPIKKLLKELSKYPEKTEQQVRTYLGGYDFKNDKVKDPIKLFSGGEKARLALAIIAYQKPNLLLMDEPTNHLDMEMRQALTMASIRLFEHLLS